MKKILLILSVAALVLTGCNKKEKGLEKQGEMSLSVTSEGEFTPITKVDTPDIVDVNDFTIQIADASSGVIEQSWDKLSEVPSVVSMDPKTYTITASSPNTKDVSWNQPIYKGTQKFTVEAGKVVNIDMKCTLKNMKVTVKCTQNFIEELNPDFTVKVGNKYGYLEFTKSVIEEGTAKAGYFSVDPLTVYVKGTRVQGGAEVSHYFTINEVAEKDHHVITVDANETGSTKVSGISIDYSVNNKEQDIQVGDLVENPVEDDLTGEPVLQNTSIAAGAEVEKTLGSISLTYSLPIALSATPNITLGDVTVTPTVSGKVLTVAFGALAEGASYTLNVPAGAVVNSTDQTAAKAASLVFTTKAAAAEVPITITATGGIESNAVYDFESYGVDFKIDITAEKGISSFPVEVKSDGLKGMIAALKNDCDETVDLANMSKAEEIFWGGLFKKTSSDIKGQTTVSFSIGSFIFMMPSGTHPITMGVVDNDGNKKEVTITFVINPEVVE